jgi:alcohol dehydrogenase
VIRPGGWVGNVGVHAKPATPHLESLWIHDDHHRPSDTFSTPTLLRAVAAGQSPTRFTSHPFPLAAAMDAYDTFAWAGETNAPEVLMTAQGVRWTTAALLPGAAHLSRVHVLAVVDRVVMGRRGG